ncbi:amine oxidase [Auricularia subglabra TFB-10046 SS5]|nr:amine oxidase [Auricularia subglabra TFB-10046 SS5]
MDETTETSTIQGPPSSSCIVIGAGISGLAAALSLAEAGRAVVIIEARSRIGGRILSLTDTLPCPIDLGATEIHGYDEGNPLKNLAELMKARIHKPKNSRWLIFGPEGRPLQHDLAIRLEDNVSHAIFQKSIEFAQLDSVPSFSASLADFVFANDSPLYDGLDNQGKAYATSLAHSWCSWMGTPFSRVSLKYWGFGRDFSGAPAYAERGYAQFVDYLWNKAKAAGVQLRMEHEVVAIEDDGAGVRVTAKTSTSLGSSEIVFNAQTCICTIPLGVLQSRPPIFSPVLPMRRMQTLARVGVGSFTKVFISYPHAWWPAQPALLYIIFSDQFPPRDAGDFGNLSGSTLSAAQEIISQSAVEVRNFVEMNGAPVLSIDFGPPAAQRIEDHTSQDIKAALHVLLAYHLGGGRADIPEPDACVVTRWNTDRYTLGAYSHIPVTTSTSTDPATPLDFVELSKPLWEGRLGFAGEHTDLDHSASAHGALLSGEREAQRVLILLAGRDAQQGEGNGDWIVVSKPRL